MNIEFIIVHILDIKRYEIMNMIAKNKFKELAEGKKYCEE